jgi:lysyl-tRNA synthetase class I
MGDRYYIPEMSCKSCKKVQSEPVYYAPSSGFESYKCEKCGEENFITMSFT